MPTFLMSRSVTEPVTKSGGRKAILVLAWALASAVLLGLVHWSLSHCSFYQPNQVCSSQYANYKDLSFCACSFWDGNIWSKAFANCISIDLLFLFIIVMSCTIYFIAKGTTPLSVKTLTKREEKAWYKMTATKTL